MEQVDVVKVIEVIANDFDDMRIEEIEEYLDGKKSAMKKSWEDFIFGLFYLERTNRFRENSFYRDLRFGEYIKGRYDMSMRFYMRHREAFLNFPKEAAKYGVDFIHQAKTKCGPLKLPAVFQDLERVQKPTQENWKQVLNKHAKPKPEKIVPINYRERYERERKLRIAAEKENEELKEQIAKLKKTVAASHRQSETQV